MASIVEICNLSLSSFGESRVIQDINEPSDHARQCKLHYDHVRRSLLSGPHEWRFAKSTPIYLEQTVANEMVDVWDYAYQLPSDFLKLTNKTEIHLGYETAGSKLYCDVDKLQIQYIKDVEDTSKFTQLFVDAFVASLAARVVFPITRDKGMRSDAVQLAKAARDSSEAQDANNDLNFAVQDSSFHAARL